MILSSLSLYLAQFDLGPFQVGLVFFSANVAYFIAALIIGPLSDKLVSLLLMDLTNNKNNV